MGQFPPQPPLQYMAPDPASQRRPSRFGRGLLGWVLFLGLALMLFMLLSKQGGNYKSITLDDFVSRLEGKEIGSVVIDADEITGHMTDGTGYRTTLPPGLAGNWSFIQWLLENSKGTASIQVRTTNSLVANILVPLIPWLLIFLFIWFFVFRQLRKSTQAQQMVQQQQQLLQQAAPGQAGQA